MRQVSYSRCPDFGDLVISIQRKFDITVRKIAEKAYGYLSYKSKSGAETYVVFVRQGFLYGGPNQEPRKPNLFLERNAKLLWMLGVDPTHQIIEKITRGVERDGLIFTYPPQDQDCPTFNGVVVPEILSEEQRVLEERYERVIRRVRDVPAQRLSDLERYLEELYDQE